MFACCRDTQGAALSLLFTVRKKSAPVMSLKSFPRHDYLFVFFKKILCYDVYQRLDRNQSVQ